MWVRQTLSTLDFTTKVKSKRIVMHSGSVVGRFLFDPFRKVNKIKAARGDEFDMVEDVQYLDALEKANPKHKGVRRRNGHICFCGHGSGVQFRNITILEPAETE